MRILLDTHVFLWLLGEPDRIGATVRENLIDRTNELYVSSVSAMEVATKTRLGRLDAPGIVETWAGKVQEFSAEPLDLTTEHALLAGSIIWDNHDPFDRMLVAQALVENLMVATNDRSILRFPGLRTLGW